MDPVLLSLLVNGSVAIIQNLPKLIELIRSANLPEADKAALIKKIQDAQASLPEWA